LYYYGDSETYISKPFSPEYDVMPTEVVPVGSKRRAGIRKQDGRRGSLLRGNDEERPGREERRLFEGFMRHTVTSHALREKAIPSGEYPALVGHDA
jgi:hypothetical protein